MRIILCGKNATAVSCLEFLIKQGDQVWAIGTGGDDGGEGWQPSFKSAAARLGAAFDQPAKINDDAFVSRLEAFKPEILISIQYDQIVRENLFRKLGAPCLNLHFSLLPRHRGVAPIAWAVCSGDREAGATLHHMVESIDAGDVITQRAVSIRDDDTARDVYDKVSEAAFELFKDAYPFTSDLLQQRLPQDRTKASYHRKGDFDFSNRRIDWNQPIADLLPWIRTMIFPPLQLPETLLNGRRLQVVAVGHKMGDAKNHKPGSVVRVSSRGIDVAACDGTIRLTEVIDPEKPGTASAALMKEIPA